MIVLDTDHLSILDRDTIEAFNIGRRLAARSANEVFATIITYEEQMRGWLAYASKAYAKLRAHVETFRTIPLLDYNAAASLEFEQLQRQGVRIGSMDLKIAAIAKANGGLLLSRNLVDFQKVPGVRVEDWTL
jgi:tRNA(fMet)-specific endonuclease VapC